jgi:two-component system sensor histidine kinase MprB
MTLLVGVAVTCGMVIVAALAIGVTNVVLRNAIDSQLLNEANLAAASLRLTMDIGDPLNPADDHPVLMGTGFGLSLQVFYASDGKLVPWQYGQTGSYPTFAVGSQDLAVAQGQGGEHVFTETVGGVEYRVATVSREFSTGDLIRSHLGTPDNPPPALDLGVQLARPMTDVQHTLHTLALIMLLVGGAGVLASMLVGMVVARAALRPVDAAADAAEHVARTQDLSALIPVTGTDEIARLAESLNSMLRALEASKARQRQLVDDASHELRTPLTSLRTNVELLIRSEANPERALPAADRADLLRDVDAQMRELTGLVSELVELARDEAQEEEPERIDLTEVVTAAVLRARRRASSRGIAIEVTSASSWIDGRPNMLERAVTNLLDNAVKFSPDGSTVRVHTAAGEVVVSDEGPGIPPADRPHVFERFYRSTEARSLPGSGLGLAIVAEAVQVHGGTVWAGAAPGGGARMRMWLPVAAGPPPELPPPGTGPSGPVAPPSRPLPPPPGGFDDDIIELIESTTPRSSGAGTTSGQSPLAGPPGDLFGDQATSAPAG